MQKTTHLNSSFSRLLFMYDFFKMKLTESNLCTFYGACKETISHLFYDCEHVKPSINSTSTIVMGYN